MHFFWLFEQNLLLQKVLQLHITHANEQQFSVEVEIGVQGKLIMKNHRDDSQYKIKTLYSNVATKAACGKECNDSNLLILHAKIS